MSTPRLTLPQYSVGGQGMASVLGNEVSNRLEQACTLDVISTTVTDPDSISPSEGDCYIVPGSGTQNEWIGKENQIAVYYGGWLYLPPRGGMVAYFRQDNSWYLYDPVGGAWLPISGGPAGDSNTGIELPGKNTDGSTIYQRTYDLATDVTGGTGTGPGLTGQNNEIAHKITDLDFSKPFQLTGTLHNPANLMYPLPAPVVIAGHAGLAVSGANIVILSVDNLTGWFGWVTFKYSLTTG